MSKFLNYLEKLDFDKLVPLWNQYTVGVFPEEYIWDSIEAYAKATGENAVDLASMVHFGWVVKWDDKVYVNSRGNFNSCRNVSDSPIDLEELADWLEETQHKVFLNWQQVVGG